MIALQIFPYLLYIPLLFEDNVVRRGHTTYFLPTAEIKDIWTYDNRKVAVGQKDDYATGCLLDYPYVKENFKLIAIELSKQQALDADSKVIQQIRFSGNVERAGNTTIFFIIEEVK